MTAPRLTAVAHGEDGKLAIASPSIGWWHPRVAAGAIVRGGDVIGELDVLGTRIEVALPADAHGAVVDRGGPGGPVGPRGAAMTAVGFGATLAIVDPSAGAGAAIGAGAHAAAHPADHGGLVFAAPLSGRFFARPGPGKPPFVAVGAEVGPGQTICMLEVMKTFNRVTYGGPGLPERARVTEILVGDEEDVTMGQGILRLEPA